MAQANLQTIQNEFWQVGILPQTGASMAFGQIRHRGQWLDFFRPTPENYESASATSSFVLVPWSNRIRDGKFSFNGQNYQLEINPKHKAAIHGTGRDVVWQVLEHSNTSINLLYRSSAYAKVNFPFRFSSEIRYQLEERSLEITLSLKNEDSQPMPGGFGHHPYFKRTLSNAADVVTVEIPCAGYWPLEEGLPSGGVLPITPQLDFQQLRTLGHALVDDCLTNRDKAKPIRFKYTQSYQEILLHCDPIFEQVITYIPEGKDFFAVEPVTNANDGFNLYSQGVPGSGVFVLQPGEVQSGTIRFEIV